jgi:hypothetical protein
VRCRRLDVKIWSAGVLEVMRRVLLCMLEAMDGEICLLEVMRCYAGGCGGFEISFKATWKAACCKLVFKGQTHFTSNLISGE